MTARDGISAMALKAKHIVVHGRVQGVGFRYFVQNTASRLGLAGNVRNCEDGTVEILVEGDARSLSAFIKEVERGPALSRVTRTDVHEIPAGGHYSSFHIEGW
jgi:acylphosphatase